MLTFSVMQHINADASVEHLIWKYIQAAKPLITRRLRACGRGYCADDVQEIQSQLFMYLRANYREEAADSSLPLEKRVESYVNHSIVQYLKGYTRTEQPVDYDRLFSADSDELTFTDVVTRNAYVEVSKEKSGKTVPLLHTLAKLQVRDLLIELALRDESVFEYFYTSLVCVEEKKKIGVTSNKRSKIASNQFIEKICDMVRQEEITVYEVMEVCKELKQYKKPAKVGTGVKSIVMRPCSRSAIVLSEFYEGMIAVQGTNKESKFNEDTLKFDKHVELELSKWKLINPRTKAKSPAIYKIKIEQFLDYVSINSLPDEEVDTPFIKWLFDKYVMILPSGARTELNISNTIYMRQVKEELLLNLLMNDIKGIFAMTEQYVYFTPPKKPSYNKVEVRLHNDKIISMGVSECCN